MYSCNSNISAFCADEEIIYCSDSSDYGVQPPVVLLASEMRTVAK